MNKLTFFTLIIIIFSLTEGCNNQKKKIDEGFKFDRDQIESEIKKSPIYLFPSPGEILNQFYAAELPYDEELLHDPNQYTDYVTYREKGLNLGVYITDLAYASLFSRNTVVSEYLDVVRKLSSELDVATTAFESLAERIGTNVGNRDSLIVLSNEAFNNVLEFLETAGRENTIALISSGAYIEAMYLALYSLEEYSENDPILQQLSELKYPLENLLKQAESVSDDPNVEGILFYIKELDKIYNELESESTIASVEAPGVITLSGGSLPDITEENFYMIKRSVLDTRTYIVGN